jgi:IPT/TIG domain
MKATMWFACAVGVAAIAACGGTAQEMGMNPAAATTNLVSATGRSIVVRNIDASVPEGGGLILFKGTNLVEGATVLFGDVPAAAAPYFDPVYGVYIVGVPAHPEAFVDITWTNPDGQSAISPNFHFSPQPVIDSLTPSTPLATGTLVTATGVNFGRGAPAGTLGMQVMVGGVLAQIVSATQTAVVFKVPKLNPLPLPAGYQVSVTNFDGLYAVAPTVLQISGRGGGTGGGSH